MAKLILIVAQSRNRVIGKGNKMPWHLPRDLAFFKAKTLGYPVIMGRKTYDSIGEALPKRLNIVLSRERHLWLPDAEVFSDLNTAIARASGAEKVFIIGGGTLYKQAFPLADTILSTWVETEIAGGDVFFPEISPESWRQISAEWFPRDGENEYGLVFSHYERKKAPAE